MEASIDTEVVVCARRFAPGAEVVRAERVGSGHIHATYRVELAGDISGLGGRERTSLSGAGAGGTALLLQRLNEQIFPDLDGLQNNLLLVTEALRARPGRRRTDDGPDLVLSVLRDREGAPWTRSDEDGSAWRAFPFLERTRSVDVADTPAQIHAAALAFGDFALGVEELPPGELLEVIPAFHDTAGRFDALAEATARDDCERATACFDEGEALRRVWAEARELFERRGGAELPKRVVHNDCKLNNALFDPEARRVRCVVDLDTAWAGTLLFDLGALLRTTASRSPEDEPDPRRIRVDPQRVEAAAQGFMAGLRRAPDELELGVLPLAGAIMALEDAARFLTDHLEGDHYFPSQREGHNLERARAQRVLAQQLLAAEDPIRAALRR